jgi:hypothetical protein
MPAGYRTSPVVEVKPSAPAPRDQGGRAGQAQKFVLPTPDLKDPSPGNQLTLSIKLLPANPARDVKDAALEILEVRLLK